MLRAAIATGMVDFVLPPERIGAELVALAHAQGTSLLQTTPDLALTDQQLNDVFDLLRPATGVDFRHYKLPTIRRRLFRPDGAAPVHHVGEYVQMLRSNPPRC
jgi:two-component system CheB/CheR fusion protein